MNRTAVLQIIKVYHDQMEIGYGWSILDKGRIIIPHLFYPNGDELTTDVFFSIQYTDNNRLIVMNDTVQ